MLLRAGPGGAAGRLRPGRRPTHSASSPRARPAGRGRSSRLPPPDRRPRPEQSRQLRQAEACGLQALLDRPTRRRPSSPKLGGTDQIRAKLQYRGSVGRVGELDAEQPPGTGPSAPPRETLVARTAEVEESSTRRAIECLERRPIRRSAPLPHRVGGKTRPGGNDTQHQRHPPTASHAPTPTSLGAVRATTDIGSGHPTPQVEPQGPSSWATRRQDLAAVLVGGAAGRAASRSSLLAHPRGSDPEREVLAAIRTDGRSPCAPAHLTDRGVPLFAVDGGVRSRPAAVGVVVDPEGSTRARPALPLSTPSPPSALPCSRRVAVNVAPLIRPTTRLPAAVAQARRRRRRSRQVLPRWTW